MSASQTVSPRTSEELLIAFLDISPFTRATARHTNEQLATLCDAVYRLIGDSVEASGGRVVKFMGDGAFVTWPKASADAGVEGLLELRDSVDQLLANEGLNARLVVKVHAGTAVTGQFGASGDLRYDVIGHDVMVAAKLEARTVAISAAAFRALQPATRQKLKRHTPGVVYIPVDDPRP